MVIDTSFAYKLFCSKSRIINTFILLIKHQGFNDILNNLQKILLIFNIFFDGHCLRNERYPIKKNSLKKEDKYQCRRTR